MSNSFPRIAMTYNNHPNSHKIIKYGADHSKRGYTLSFHLNQSIRPIQKIPLKEYNKILHIIYKDNIKLLNDIIYITVNNCKVYVAMPIAILFQHSIQLTSAFIMNYLNNIIALSKKRASSSLYGCVVAQLFLTLNSISLKNRIEILKMAINTEKDSKYIIDKFREDTIAYQFAFDTLKEVITPQIIEQYQKLFRDIRIINEIILREEYSSFYEPLIMMIIQYYPYFSNTAILDYLNNLLLSKKYYNYAQISGFTPKDIIWYYQFTKKSIPLSFNQIPKIEQEILNGQDLIEWFYHASDDDIKEFSHKILQFVRPSQFIINMLYFIYAPFEFLYNTRIDKDGKNYGWQYKIRYMFYAYKRGEVPPEVIKLLIINLINKKTIYRQKDIKNLLNASYNHHDDFDEFQNEPVIAKTRQYIRKGIDLSKPETLLRAYFRAILTMHLLMPLYIRKKNRAYWNGKNKIKGLSYAKFMAKAMKSNPLKRVVMT